MPNVCDIVTFDNRNDIAARGAVSTDGGTSVDEKDTLKLYQVRSIRLEFISDVYSVRW